MRTEDTWFYKVVDFIATNRDFLLERVAHAAHWTAIAVIASCIYDATVSCWFVLVAAALFVSSWIIEIKRNNDGN